MFYHSFTFKLPVKQHLSDFSALNPGKTMLISIIYRIIVLSYHTIYPENIAFFIAPYQMG